MSVFVGGREDVTTLFDMWIFRATKQRSSGPPAPVVWLVNWTPPNQFVRYDGQVTSSVSSDMHPYKGCRRVVPPFHFNSLWLSVNFLVSSLWISLSSGLESLQDSSSNSKPLQILKRAVTNTFDYRKQGTRSNNPSASLSSGQQGTQLLNGCFPTTRKFIVGFSLQNLFLTSASCTLSPMAHGVGISVPGDPSCE